MNCPLNLTETLHEPRVRRSHASEIQPQLGDKLFLPNALTKWVNTANKCTWHDHRNFHDSLLICKMSSEFGRVRKEGKKQVGRYKGLSLPVSSFISQLKLGKIAKYHLKIEATARATTFCLMKPPKLSGLSSRKNRLL